MALDLRIDQDIKTAMLGGDKLTAEILKGVKNAVIYAQKKAGRPLDDSEIEAVLQTEQKRRDEAAELYQRGGNQQAADKERQEKAIIARYLPSPLSDDELEALVDRAAADKPGTGLGELIAEVRRLAGSRSDGARIAAAVRRKLGQS